MGQRTDWNNLRSAKFRSVAKAQEGFEPQTPRFPVICLIIEPKGYTLDQVDRTDDQLEPW